ncbi:MAG: hypothetical protein IPP98_09260 [Gemmatimonadetes bacterium]|nr:hypothetical protein [Gemmatimonadota bacterium]
MMLFKASGETYDRVITQRAHAFRGLPRGFREHQTVLLSKNRSGMSWCERQVQHLARIRTIRKATPAELERFYPGVNAGARWRYLVELYAVTPLTRQFDLSQVPGLDAKRYQTVQSYSLFSEAEDLALLQYFRLKNTQAIIDILNADPEAEWPLAAWATGPGLPPSHAARRVAPR